jgi:hypothetical protein
VLSVAVKATVALGADYEIFAPTFNDATRINHYTVERLDSKDKHLYHCEAVFDSDSNKLAGQCTERPGFSPRSAVQGPNVQRAASNIVGKLPFGFWQIDRTTGKTEFCTLGLLPEVPILQSEERAPVRPTTNV